MEIIGIMGITELFWIMGGELWDFLISFQIFVIFVELFYPDAAPAGAFFSSKINF